MDGCRAVERACCTLLSRLLTVWSVSTPNPYIVQGSTDHHPGYILASLEAQTPLPGILVQLIWGKGKQVNEKAFQVIFIDDQGQVNKTDQGICFQVILAHTI